MSMRKRFNIVEPILNELFDNGLGTRMELFERTGFDNWGEFKRHISFLLDQGLIKSIPIPERLIVHFDLTREGLELVQSLRG